MGIKKLIAMMLVSSAVSFAQTSKPRLAVLPLANPSDQPKSTIGENLSHILETEIRKTGKFQLLDRENLQQLMKEMDLGQSSAAKGTTFAKKGNIKGAEFVLEGRVENFSYRETITGGGYGASRRQYGPGNTYQQMASVRIGFHVIRVDTSETVLTESGEGQLINVSMKSEQGIWLRCLQGSFSAVPEFQISLIGRATMQAVSKVVRKVSDLSGTIAP